jgi:hypothetical protein
VCRVPASCGLDANALQPDCSGQHQRAVQYTLIHAEHVNGQNLAWHTAGRYRVVFATEEYMAVCRQQHPGIWPEQPFYPTVSVVFNVMPDQVSAWPRMCCKAQMCAVWDISLSTLHVASW